MIDKDLDVPALDLLLLGAALGSGLIAGVFFAFSTFVMRALGSLPAAQGVAAMQSINIVVINPWFMGAFFGTALLCIAAAIATVIADHPATPWIIAGALIYIFGSIGVTIVFNVPRNEALGRRAPDTAEAAALWKDYLVEWTAWNTVRTAASLAASAAFIIALG